MIEHFSKPPIFTKKRRFFFFLKGVLLEALNKKDEMQRYMSYGLVLEIELPS